MRTRVVMLLCALVVAVGLVGAGYLLSARTADSQQTTRALCALRDDIKRRVQSSRDFLAAHPNGIPGIPAKTIRDGIRNQQRTVDALHDLKCPD